MHPNMPPALAIAAIFLSVALVALAGAPENAVIFTAFAGIFVSFAALNTMVRR